MSDLPPRYDDVVDSLSDSGRILSKSRQSDANDQRTNLESSKSGAQESSNDQPPTYDDAISDLTPPFSRIEVANGASNSASGGAIPKVKYDMPTAIVKSGDIPKQFIGCPGPVGPAHSVYVIDDEARTATDIFWVPPDNSSDFLNLIYEVQGKINDPWITLAERKDKVFRVYKSNISVRMGKIAVSRSNSAVDMFMRIRAKGIANRETVVGPWSIVITIRVNEKKAVNKELVPGKAKSLDKVCADIYSFTFWKHTKSENLTWQEPTLSANKGEIIEYVVEYLENDAWKEIVRTSERWTKLGCDGSGHVSVGSKTFTNDFTLRIGCRMQTGKSLITGMYSGHVTVSAGRLHPYELHPEFF